VVTQSDDPVGIETGISPLRKGQTVRLRILSLAAGGEGLSKDFGIPIFVNRVAPGDLVDVRLFDVRKQFAKGEVVELIEPSELRAKPPCPLFNVCGGCQWQHMSYEYQLDAKSDIVKQALKHIGKIDGSIVQPTLSSVKPLTYRNKAQFPVASVAKTGRILAGYYQQNSHELVNIKHCPVQPEVMDRVLETTKEILQSIDLSTYDERTGVGLLRHIAERYSFAHNKVLLTLVLNHKPRLPHDLSDALIAAAREIMQKVPEVSGVCLNFNPASGNRIMGDTTTCVSGEPFLVEVMRSSLPNAPEKLREGLKFRLSATSFFQVNSEQAAVLLDQVLLAATGQESVAPADAHFNQQIPLLIDAYAGVGTMGMWLSSVCERIIAIEELASSVENGEVNLALNDLKNVGFVQDRVEEQVVELLSQGARPDVVVVDPPRKGIDPGGLRSIIQLAPSRIVYVSCNPATLARDLRILEDSGYKTKRVQPIDMFPQTYHVESVAVLEKV